MPPKATPKKKPAPKPQPTPKPAPTGSGAGGTTSGGTTPGPAGTGSTGGGTTPGTTGGGGGGRKPPDPPPPDCGCLVMVPCTTDLRGTFKVSLHDAGGPDDQFVEVECRVHAIGFRQTEVDVKADNAPEKPGTWYLITLEELEWKPNPMWIHEASSNLDLGF